MSILGQFQFRRDISANWALANPVLLDGEMGIESNTNQFKIGNGVLTWNSLPYGGIVGALYPEELLFKNPYFIRDEADSLAEMLRQKGFDVQVDHSGSQAGPSSYLKVYDPITGRIVADNLRLSAHSKGAYNSSLVQNINRDQFPQILELAENVRQMGKSDTMLQQEKLDEIASQLIQQGKKPKSAYKEARRQLYGD